MDEPLAVVLAAGKGTRMETSDPKVLVSAAGRPLIEYVLDALRAVGIGRICVVVGYKSEMVKAALAKYAGLEFVEQTEQLGTGHAVMMARPVLKNHQGPVVIVTGDSPLLQVSSLRALLEEYHRAKPACLLGTLHKDNPRGLGRIVRNADGIFEAIVEEKDATEEQRKITEVNMSTYLFEAQALLSALDRLGTNNQQQEYYITDCPGILKEDGQDVRALAALAPCEALSVNNRADLAAVEEELRK